MLRKQVEFDWIEILILSSVLDNVKMQRLFSILLLELVEDTVFSLGIGQTWVDSP